MKIAIFGDVSDRIALQEAIQEVKKDLDIEIVDIDIFEDDEIVVMCGHPLANVGVEIECYTDKSYDDGTQHWRGGARGKGGKIKYARS